MPNTETEAPLTCRVPRWMLEKLDQRAEKLRRQHPGFQFSRSDVLRQLLTEALGRPKKTGGPR